MKRIILFALLLFTASLNAQTYWWWGDGGGYGADAGRVYAVDLDGSTEYAENTSPVNLDLNGANTITSLPRNSTFEDNATDWATNGTHVVSVDGTSKLTGTYSGKIAASGVGDSTTNFASLADDKYTAIVSGTKYTLQIEVRAVLADTDVILVIGGKAKTFTAVDQTSETLVFNFLATSAEVGQKIIIYLSQADDVFIDEIDLSQAFDMTGMAWVYTPQDGVHKTILSRFQSNNPYSFHWMIVSNEKLRITINDIDNQNLLANSTTLIPVNTWTLVAFTTDRTGVIANYINGVLDGPTTDITGLGTTRGTANLEVGRRTTSGDREFKGKLGETQIIRGQILTAAEILTAYNRGLKGKHFLETGNEVGWWQWEGDLNAVFFSDQAGLNDLTGVNVTRDDDQVKLKKYKD